MSVLDVKGSKPAAVTKAEAYKPSLFLWGIFLFSQRSEGGKTAHIVRQGGK